MSTSQHECACDLDWSTGEYLSCRGNSPDCPVRLQRQLRSQRASVTRKGETGVTLPASSRQERQGQTKSKRYSDGENHST